MYEISRDIEWKTPFLPMKTIMDDIKCMGQPRNEMVHIPNCSPCFALSNDIWEKSARGRKLFKWLEILKTVLSCDRGKDYDSQNIS